MNGFKKLMCNSKCCCQNFFRTAFTKMHNSTCRFLIFLRRFLHCCPSSADDMGSKLSHGVRSSSRNNVSTSLSEDEIELLMTSTTMNHQEILDFHENFLKDCPSGVLTKIEFVKMFKQLHPSDSKKQKVDKFCEYVFRYA